MATNLSRCLLASALAIVVPASGQTAPALGEKPTKWEYAELTFTSRQRPPVGGQPGGAVQVVIRVQWSTADQAIDAKSWDEVADKFKVPSVKEEGTMTQQKLRLLNRLGTEGWEMVSHEKETPGAFGGSESWTFKRRVP